MDGRPRNEALHTVSTAYLVAQSNNGGADAFVELVRRHRSLIHRTALSYMRNHADAEDVSQDVLLSLFLKLNTFQGNSSFSSWLTRIVINASLQALRKQRARPAIALEEMMTDGEYNFLPLAESTPGPEQQCSIQEKRRLLIRTVSQLPDQLRHVAEDHLYLQLSSSEIADKRGISLAAAKSRSHRARKKISSVLSHKATGINTRIAHG